MTVVRETGAPGDIVAFRGRKTGKCRKKHSIPIITSENEKSLRFHEKHGFAKRGELVGVGYKFGKTLGVYYYSIKL